MNEMLRSADTHDFTFMHGPGSAYSVVHSKSRDKMTGSVCEWMKEEQRDKKEDVNIFFTTQMLFLLNQKISVEIS